MTHSPQISPATPFHSLKPDCIFAILNHVLFEIDSPPTWNYPEWKFMARFASCLRFLPNFGEEQEKEFTLAHVKDILRRCRCQEKNCFYSLNFSGFTLDNDVFPLMRGVKELDILATRGWTGDVFENLRGVQKLNVSMGPPGVLEEEHFQNLRGISELIISDYEEFSLTPGILKDLRGIKVLHAGEDRHFPGPYEYLHDSPNTTNVEDTENIEFMDDAFKNLRGIRELDISSTSITEECFKHLRGIQSLAVRGCPHVNVSSKSLSNLRGVKKVSIVGLKGNFTDESLRELRGVTDFEFNCHPCQFTQHGIANLRGVKKFTFYHRSDKDIKTALSELKGVEELSLHCEYMDGHITDKDLANFVGLRQLELSQYNLTSITQESLRYFKTMDRVILDWCSLPPIEKSQWKTSKGRVRVLECHVNGEEWDETYSVRDYAAFAKGEDYAQMMFGDADLWH